jgi:ankyrin repeat protein
MCSTEDISSKSLLLGLPNELLYEVASNLDSFEDLHSLVRTSRFFHRMFNTQLYRRAVAADYAVRHDIVRSVLHGYRLAALTLLLDHGLSVDHTGRFVYNSHLEETMLCFLCRLYNQERSVPLARLLIERGADVNAKAPDGLGTVLHIAVCFNNVRITSSVFGRHATAYGNDPDKKGQLPRLRFVHRGTVILELLLAHGAAVDARTDRGETPLLLATNRWGMKIIPMLLAHGADAGAPNLLGETPLHRAAINFGIRHYILAKSLLEHGAHVDGTAGDGSTPLHRAVGHRPTKDRVFMVKFLLEHGADANAISNNGATPLGSVRPIGAEGDGVRRLLREHGALR